MSVIKPAAALTVTMLTVQREPKKRSFSYLLALAILCSIKAFLLDLSVKHI